MHDDMQMIRQLEMEKCFKDGQIPCRWTPDLAYGYGLPLFNYYPPLPYIIGQVFRILGISFVNTIKYTAILQILFSAYFMYLLATNIFGPFGGLISGLFYTYAPYHALNIFVRGAMNEAWAAVFFPLILLTTKKFIDTSKLKYLIGFSVAFSLLLLSHNPMVLIFTPFLAVWIIFLIISSTSNQANSVVIKLTKLFIFSLFSIGLSAFFTIPALLETNLVQIEKMFSEYYSYFNHFANLFQIFISSFWGNGSSIWGQNDGMSFSIGYLHWIIPIIILSLLVIKFIRYRQATILELLVILIIFMGFGSLFMTHERSTFIWKIFPFIQKIQFPWRFLNITTVFFSLSVGYLPKILNSKTKSPFIYRYLIISIIPILLILNLKYFTPLTFGPLTDGQKFSGQAWVNQISGGINDYLPRQVNIPIIQQATNFIDEITPFDTDYILSGMKKGTDWQLFNITLSKPATIFLPSYIFPNFQLFINRNPSFQFETDIHGRIAFNLDSGQHQIFIKLKNTPVRSLANIISFISLFFILPILIFYSWKKQR